MFPLAELVISLKQRHCPDFPVVFDVWVTCLTTSTAGVLDSQIWYSALELWHGVGGSVALEPT